MTASNLVTKGLFCTVEGQVTQGYFCGIVGITVNIVRRLAVCLNREIQRKVIVDRIFN